MNEYELYLCHHGVKGMKWGVRKAKKLVRTSGRFLKKTAGYASKTIAKGRVTHPNGSNKSSTTMKNNEQYKDKVSKAKKAVKVGAAVAGTVLAVYGAKKLNDVLHDFNYEQGMRAIERIQRAHDLSYQRYWVSQHR